MENRSPPVELEPMISQLHAKYSNHQATEMGHFPTHIYVRIMDIFSEVNKRNTAATHGQQYPLPTAEGLFMKQYNIMFIRQNVAYSNVLIISGFV